MLLGVPQEIKVHEYRVGLTPDSARELVTHGHKVLIQANAGAGIGCADERYRTAGAEIAAHGRSNAKSSQRYVDTWIARCGRP